VIPGISGIGASPSSTVLTRVLRRAGRAGIVGGRAPDPVRAIGSYRAAANEVDLGEDHDTDGLAVPEKRRRRTYGDGHPFDRIHYLECKVILKPELFTSVRSFHEFGALVRDTAAALALRYFDEGVTRRRPRIREVLFFDTPAFTFYNNAFILRRRIPYQDGFPVGEPEIVLKFRHPRLRKAAALDMRPNIPGRYQIKFKSEVLPLRDRIGGFRRLFSHNVEFKCGQARDEDRASMTRLAQVFPPLSNLIRAEAEDLAPVNQAIVEEVLLDLGRLDFGTGVTAASNVALWRQRGDHAPLVSEFSFQCSFRRGAGFHDEAMLLCEQFFLSLQENVSGWVLLGTTKTGIIYGLGGNPPRSHE
jgi:hypothetical protein